MDYTVDDLRTAQNSFTAILQALLDLHNAGVDRTNYGCQSMAHMTIALERSLTEAGHIINNINDICGGYVL